MSCCQSRPTDGGEEHTVKNAIEYAILLLVSVVVIAGCVGRYESATPDSYSKTANAAEELALNLREGSMTPYFKAVQAYREFLLNRRIADRDIESDGQSRRIYRYMHYNNIENKFTILDLDDDGIPELHLMSTRYFLFTYENEDVRSVWSWGANERSQTTLLNNRAMFSKTEWMHAGTDYNYTEFGKGKNKIKFQFELGDIEGVPHRYWISSLDDLSEDEYARVKTSLFDLADKVNSDMIPWINYSEWYLEHFDEYLPIAETETESFSPRGR
jgi:hypothetical protein